MSTDDSISEDVSSSGALSHCHVSADRYGGKGSEASLLSSEGTSASGLAVSENRNVPSQTTEDTVESRPMDDTPACNKIRSLCLRTEEAFKQGKNLPLINPSSLETLRALVQEIQNSGETDPQIWKDCEGRWLHLFQLVEKQYQEQILVQQEQYKCQIQLIQDEIKALVQLQNRQPSVQPNTEFSTASMIKTTADTNCCNFPLISSDWTIPRNLSSYNDSLAAPSHSPFSSPSPPIQRSETANQGEKQVAREHSSGYGTLSASEMCLEPAWSPEEDRNGGQEREKHHWSSKSQETTVTGCQQDLSSERTVEEDNPSVFRQRTCGSNSQPLTSWAQRQKLRPKKSTKEHASSQTPVHQRQTSSPREHCRQIPPESTHFQAQHRPAGLSSSSILLRRSDSLMSEASGLSYWRLNEHELYRPLPDSFDSGAYLCLQEASTSLPQPQECWLSLREIYQNKQRAECKHSDWEASVTSSPSSPQVLFLDPAVNMRQSDCTSGFTSPSHFSSQSFHNHPHLNPRVRTLVSPDSMVDCSPRPGDVDFISDSSSVSVTRPSTNTVQSLWGNTSQTVLSSSIDNTQPCSDTANQQRITTVPFASEEEGRHTHTSTQKPCIASGANLQPLVSPLIDRSSLVEDPVVLSLLRQNLREKHSRHVADLKAYYESEIQILTEKLKLRGLPQDLQKSNHALTERCKHLERALAEATSRIQELEATNCLLEKKMADLAERYAVAAAAVKSLQTRLEESKCSAKEKDALAVDLKTRIQQLEEAALKACQEADEKKAKMEREHQTLQDLFGEYDSLIREHEQTKNKVVSVETKLVDANDHITELKSVISKLESQVKQLEHENQTRARYTSHSKAQRSGTGLLPEIPSRKSSCLLTNQMNCDRKNSCPQTNQLGVHKNSQYASSDQSSGPGSSVDTSSAVGRWRCASPTECEQSQTGQQEQSQWETIQTQTSGALTPMMRALIELEETRATESRAPWVGSQRTTVGFLERRQKEQIQERVGLKTDRKVAHLGGTVVGVEQGGATKSLSGPGRAAALLGSLSPESQRSSSLPPPVQRNLPTTSPRRRDTLLLPKSAKSSPKRCPTENYSTAFGDMMPREEYLIKRFGKSDQRHHSLHSSSPRKRLQFTSTDKEDDCCPPNSSGSMNPSDESPELGLEEQDNCGSFDLQDFSSLAEAEKLFDELTKEKLQIEAALSRMPGAGGRQSLQTRLDEVALDNRLERLNRELGSIRMTLKRFNILRCSANV